MRNGMVTPTNRTFEGRVTDKKTGRAFTVTTEAKDANHARQILESQHNPNRVDFIREIY